MERKFYHYTLWEDWINGLYDPPSKQMYNKIIDCKNILGNNKEFIKCIDSLFSEWKISTELNLTNKEQNRRAWVGQASVCKSLQVCDDIVKIAWSELTTEQQDEANKIADEKIAEWEIKYNGGVLECQKSLWD